MTLLYRYTSAIADVEATEGPQRISCLRNPKVLNFEACRSSTYEKLGLYENALIDAESVISKTNSTPTEFNAEAAKKFQSVREKALLCKLNSLWGLRRYCEALAFIESILPDYSDKIVFTTMHERAQIIVQQSRGNIDLLELHNLHKERRHYVGEYLVPVKIDLVPNRGRGVVALRDIEVGEVIMLLKAFCIVFQEDVTSFQEQMFVPTNYRNFLVDSEAVAASKLHQMLSCDIEQPQLNRLYRGHFKPQSLIEDNYRIIRYNALKSVKDPETKTPSYCGLWILGSFLNHSCIDSNAYHSVFGDALLVRAVKPIKAGEEITITYWNPARFLKRRLYMARLGFQCDCRLCKMEDNESESTSKEIQRLAKFINRGTHMKDEQLVMDDCYKKFCRMRKILELRASKGFPDTTVCVLGPHVDKIIEGLDKLGKYKHKIYLQEKIHDFCKNNCFVLKSVTAAKIIMFEYLNNFNDLKSTIQWWKQLKSNAIAAYGNEEMLETMKILPPEEIQYFNSMEEDIDVLNDKEMMQKYRPDWTYEEEDSNDNDEEEEEGASYNASPDVSSSSDDEYVSEGAEGGPRDEYFFDEEGYPEDRNSIGGTPHDAGQSSSAPATTDSATDSYEDLFPSTSSASASGHCLCPHTHLH